MVDKKNVAKKTKKSKTKAKITVNIPTQSRFKRYYLNIKNKNWQADKDAFINSWKVKIKEAKPYIHIFGWYTFLIASITIFFMPSVQVSIELKILLFSFALYVLYEKLRDDYIEVLEVKEMYSKEHKK